jgi:putative nucleotidyltransferase with HDIG domain
MLPNIVKHSLKVMQVSLAITDNLKSGVSVNRDLVQAAALLHDITKTKSLATREHHDASGGALLRELGFVSTAEIVEQHVIILNVNPEGRLEEREIVYYADKRVLHDTVVTLEERVCDLIQRYGVTERIQDQIRRNKTQALTIEKKIVGLIEGDLQIILSS